MLSTALKSVGAEVTQQLQEMCSMFQDQTTPVSAELWGAEKVLTTFQDQNATAFVPVNHPSGVNGSVKERIYHQQCPLVTR